MPSVVCFALAHPFIVLMPRGSRGTNVIRPESAVDVPGFVTQA